MSKALLFLLLPMSLYAHPGIGIVKDTKGKIYYTDLKHVWRVDQNGKKEIAVPNVHTHQLFMDEKDDLYGEHVWYNGETLNTWGRYIWCLRNNGKLDTVHPVDSKSQLSLVQDTSGNMYWVERSDKHIFKKKTSKGEVLTLAEGVFKEVRWLYASKKGDLYFIDWHSLYKLDPSSGRFSLLAKDMAESSVAFGPMGSGRHSLFGIWEDFNNIYVANYSGQVVKRISSDGSLTNVVYSTTPWSPTGGLFDQEGNLWLLEYSLTNSARVRKVKATDVSTAPLKIIPAILNDAVPTAIIATLIFLFLLGFYKLIRQVSS